MLRRFAPLAAAAAALLALAPADARPRLSPEEQLAKELNGRVAGEPVSCINLRNVRSSRIIRDTAIVYDAGSTIYVNRPRAGADSLSPWDTQVTRPFSSQLCSVDTVKMVDPTSNFMTGLVFLGEFVPYRKVR
jgi:hypothetical protein